MLNFSVGPVLMDEETKIIGSYDVPYFRTAAFSEIMLSNERMMIELARAEATTRLITLTGSGTLAMDATISSCFNASDRLLIINGGSFGQRFCDIAACYQIPFDTIDLNFGEAITPKHFESINLKNYSALLINADETSSGVLHDLDFLGNLCRSHQLFFVVDAISSFLADSINFSKFNIDVMIVGSQKALALPPGLSLLLCSQSAQERIHNNKIPVYYQNLKYALSNAERGQTPFTPAVGIILQLHHRLKYLCEIGIDKQIERTRQLADYFRKSIVNYPFEYVTTSKSNAVTALYVSEHISAMAIVKILEERFKIWVCPNGGEMSERVFRVGHIGNLTENHIDQLIFAFEELQKEGIIR